MEQLSFLMQALMHPRTIGSIMPSSRTLARKMVAPINFSNARCIVELGPGTGAITREILQRMRRDTRLIAFEINPLFCSKLRKLYDPRLVVVHDTAEKLDALMRAHGLGKADYVISGLPLATLDQNTVTQILAATRQALRKNGKYIQFQYSLVSRTLLRKNFSHVKFGFMLFNFPPAFVYSCENKPSSQKSHVALHSRY